MQRKRSRREHSKYAPLCIPVFGSRLLLPLLKLRPGQTRKQCHMTSMF